MRVVLADLKGRIGFVSKDTVAGGYGSRFAPFSRTTFWVHRFKSRYSDAPSVHIAYLAAILAEAGHDVGFTNGAVMDADTAIILSSLVDYRHETEWADAARARGVRVGFVGLAASKLPHLFTDHADFVVDGEPEEAIGRLAKGERLSGVCRSEPTMNLDSLPFPRWDLVSRARPSAFQWTVRPTGGAFPLLASRGCPEFCTYCPHRIQAGYRARSVGNIVDEIERLCESTRRPYIIFRDAVFSEDRARVIDLCRQIRDRRLDIRFECETRLDRLDRTLLEIMRGAGLRAISFGVEAASQVTLKKAGRRPIPSDHQRRIIWACQDLGITTSAFFMLGFPSDDWLSVAATIDFAVRLDPTFAQFKLVTPYPATPLWRQVEPLVFEKNWEAFDGFTPTFALPNLSPDELKFLLGSAYTRFYIRPSFLTSLMKLRGDRLRRWVGRLDRFVLARHTKRETRVMKPVTC
jgi:anaerobic magnesium-protoporphyrin IX monomethyl ester cyclase